ncbi:peptidylprolyl isomerase [uncultured Desulfovibrio sp.]|uniref:peptidylprolyl isomerase n=1 Tax=uncultured Desulfovibrio sp. TaxID=167968 RepID=UPI00263712B8|nr:peptidylprolyl isomerase [uncultured Desulfovibrio sp.]
MLQTFLRRALLAVLAACLLGAVPFGPAQAAGPDPVVKLETSLGDIVLRLDATKAPRTVANFVEYVRAGQYDGTIFHRVIRDFMIQGGGMTPDLREKPTRAPIRNEADNGLENRRYTIAMARTAEPHSATSQFFINTRDNAFLDYRGATPQGWGYAVFGKVIRGQNVVDKIAAVPTTSRGFYDDVPQEPVIIKRAIVVE